MQNESNMESISPGFQSYTRIHLNGPNAEIAKCFVYTICVLHIHATQTHRDEAEKWKESEESAIKEEDTFLFGHKTNQIYAHIMLNQNQNN